jgi:hypothetical protein
MSTISAFFFTRASLSRRLEEKQSEYSTRLINDNVPSVDVGCPWLHEVGKTQRHVADGDDNVGANGRVLRLLQQREKQRQLLATGALLDAKYVRCGRSDIPEGLADAHELAKGKDGRSAEHGVGILLRRGADAHDERTELAQ